MGRPRLFWMRIEGDIVRNPKVIALARSLRVNRWQVVGHLIEFWTNVLRYRPDGNLDGLPEIEVCRWAGEVTDEHGRVSAVFRSWVRKAIEVGLLDSGVTASESGAQGDESQTSRRRDVDEVQTPLRLVSVHEWNERYAHSIREWARKERYRQKKKAPAAAPARKGFDAETLFDFDAETPNSPRYSTVPKTSSVVVVSPESLTKDSCPASPDVPLFDAGTGKAPEGGRRKPKAPTATWDALFRPAFYDRFPRRVHPDAALKTWRSMIPANEVECGLLAKRVSAWLDYYQRTDWAKRIAEKDKEHLPHPATWLNANRSAFKEDPPRGTETAGPPRVQRNVYLGKRRPDGVT